MDNQISIKQTIASLINSHPQESLAVIQDAKEFYLQCKQMDLVAKQSDDRLAAIAMKYKICEDFLEKTFGEREKALSNDYAVLNKAIETNDRELIIQAMKNISSIVVKSPLEDFESFVQLFNDESKPLLDF